MFRLLWYRVSVYIWWWPGCERRQNITMCNIDQSSRNIPVVLLQLENTKSIHNLWMFYEVQLFTCWFTEFQTPVVPLHIQIFIKGKILIPEIFVGLVYTIKKRISATTHSLYLLMQYPCNTWWWSPCLQEYFGYFTIRVITHVSCWFKNIVL